MAKTQKSATKTHQALPSGALAEVLPAPDGLGPDSYSPAKFGAIMWRVASGATVKAACAAEGVNFTTLYYWLLRAPELERMWRAARRLAAQSMFDRALEQVEKLIAKSGSVSGSEVRALDVAQNALRGMAEVMNPSEFSNRQAVTPPVMVKIVTTLNLTPGANLRESDQEDVYTMAARVIDEEGHEVAPAQKIGAQKRQSTGKLVQGAEVVSDD